MPTYDYVCLKCNRQFEYTQPITSQPLDACIFDDCGGKVKRRIGTGAGVIFKGSGFYETDYKRKNGNGASAKEAASASSSESSSAPAKSESSKSESPAAAASAAAKTD
ncbi:MAG: Zinc ribbon domain protein [candidate division BRC1 bacterium ADurb.BinA364]|nr:MAG: Zinc ribbon domain protein [candidate division BRC1 bacterium ADurb.BinA364]